MNKPHEIFILSSLVESDGGNEQAFVCFAWA